MLRSPHVQPRYIARAETSGEAETEKIIKVSLLSRWAGRPVRQVVSRSSSIDPAPTSMCPAGPPREVGQGGLEVAAVRGGLALDQVSGQAAGDLCRPWGFLLLTIFLLWMMLAG